ncbi:DUF302 domain-containing protein [Granulosicoccaceae sp. 1_MG-2023]|nr:DUF302 domain-containing protein [Granulosicoccaceae sp. 1_MG-2023]
MKRSILSALALCLFAVQALAAEGMVNVRSSHSVNDTADRLESVLKEKGMTVMNRVRHSESAEKAGIELRDTQLLIFGNPKVGSPLMQCQQTVALDLPQKALIWQDEEDVVWVSYNDPQYLVSRHGIEGCDEVIAKVSNALAAFAKAAAGE